MRFQERHEVPGTREFAGLRQDREGSRMGAAKSDKALNPRLAGGGS
ncbi:hypothetical protein MCBRY_002962 [Methylocystis bryophila]